MGLDGVELVMALEEQFGIEISDAEAERCLTPGDVIEVILGKVRLAQRSTCVSQRAFHRLRRGLMTISGAAREAVVLDAPVHSFAGPGREKDFWLALEESLGAPRWPALVRSDFWVGVIGAAAVAAGAMTWWYGPGEQSGFCGLVMGGFVAAAGERMTRSCKNRIPPSFRTVRSLVPFAASAEGLGFSRDGVAQVVRTVVMEQLSLQPEQYREDARFVEDLGLD